MVELLLKLITDYCLLIAASSVGCKYLKECVGDAWNKTGSCVPDLQGQACHRATVLVAVHVLMAYNLTIIGAFKLAFQLSNATDFLLRVLHDAKFTSTMFCNSEYISKVPTLRKVHPWHVIICKTKAARSCGLLNNWFFSQYLLCCNPSLTFPIHTSSF